jgi:hypothetical protein
MLMLCSLSATNLSRQMRKFENAVFHCAPNPTARRRRWLLVLIGVLLLADSKARPGPAAQGRPRTALGAHARKRAHTQEERRARTLAHIASNSRAHTLRFSAAVTTAGALLFRAFACAAAAV